MELRESIGIDIDGENANQDDILKDRIKLQLLMSGFHVDNVSKYVADVIAPMVDQSRYCRKSGTAERCGADKRIEEFLKKYLCDVADEKSIEKILPESDFICSKYGMARVLSLPDGADEFHSEYVDSYRTCNGILNNPSTDKRTTKDVFHVVEGGCPVPDDKIEVPKIAFFNMLKMAFHPNDGMLTLPFTSLQKNPVRTFISNYMTPVVCPAMPGIQREKRMEVRFFVPASLVSILDFTESIFGNAGSPFFLENDMALMPQNWSGYTGCIVFAPQLRKCTKKELGLPHVSDATDRQKMDGMCWENENDIYHDGKPFKIMARDGGNVVVSIVADSYNGYGKKEIKTQMSYVANMMGACEEEHSGGTLVFKRKDIGDNWTCNSAIENGYVYDDFLKYCSGSIEKKDGYAVDKKFDNIIYLPETANFSLPELIVSWDKNDHHFSLPLELGHVYVLPSGDRVHVEKPDIKGSRWKMIGTQPDGIFCYKPATVSGGGKSEIAKPIDEFISSGSALVCNFENDIKFVEEICSKDFSTRFKDGSKSDNRPFFDSNRTLGSVIKLLTPNDYYTDEYNDWLKCIPKHILEFVFLVKRFCQTECRNSWQSMFSVDMINGEYGKELKYRGEKLLKHYLRIGFDSTGKWRMFSLRDDFIPSEKFQLADDITVSAVLPSNKFLYLPHDDERSVKVVNNCEYRLYQRPDEAVMPGYDIGTEDDMAGKNIFTCNFKPLTRGDVNAMMRDGIRFAKYSKMMQSMLKNFVNDTTLPGYAACPSELRKMKNGDISKNQRYLQNRSDIADSFKTYLTNLSLKLNKRVIGDVDATSMPVDSILSGRRNNPPMDGIRPLCVYSPLHYMETPELFMEYMSSMTGKSPSTTGAGLEGAMTKGPFNCLNSVYDLNNALLGFILTKYAGFLSAAGYVGPNIQVDHDITYMLPEIWCGMNEEERTPEFLIKHGYLERCENFEHNGKTVQAERLGYRITRKFVRIFGARVFSSADALFTDEMLRPELQNIDIFSDSMETILDAHKRAAELVINSDEIKQAIPPLKALLYITAYGDYDGMKLRDDGFRKMFKYDNVVNSNWYLERLKCYKNAQIEHLTDGRARLQAICDSTEITEETAAMMEDRLRDVEKELSFVRSQEYLQAIVGTLGKHVTQ